jgi:hypothetical protein
MPAGEMGDHVHIFQFRIGNMVHRRQYQPLLHRLDPQRGLDRGGSPQRVPDLGLVRRYRYFFQVFTEYFSQAFDFDFVAFWVDA